MILAKGDSNWPLADIALIRPLSRRQHGIYLQWFAEGARVTSHKDVVRIIWPHDHDQPGPLTPDFTNWCFKWHDNCKPGIMDTSWT